MRQLRWRSRLTLDVHGAAELGDPSGPAVIVANYASPADPLLVISALPRAWRRRLVVCLPQPDSSEPAPRRWRPPGRTVLVGAGTGRTAAGVLDDVLAGHGSVLCFPEDARSRDGFPGAFRPEILGVAVRRGVPVVPVGLRGSYAAVPDEARRGRSRWSQDGPGSASGSVPRSGPVPGSRRPRTPSGWSERSGG